MVGPGNLNAAVGLALPLPDVAGAVVEAEKGSVALAAEKEGAPGHVTGVAASRLPTMISQNCHIKMEFLSPLSVYRWCF